MISNFSIAMQSMYSFAVL